jgi:CD2 antigen cytoplasmic tail-binding protein 2
MAALTRYGTIIRDLQMQKQNILKKSKLKKRKRKKATLGANEGGDSTDDKEPHNAEASSEDDSNSEVMNELKSKMDRTRDTVEELTEIADALLFGGETEAYELTKMDWIHRYKLAEDFPMSSSAQMKRPIPFDDMQGHATKKSRVGYFDTISDTNAEQQQTAATASHQPPKNEVTWEYKGNEDGIIHGPYSSRQMLEWTTCGYFIGASAVDIRQVGSSGDATNDLDEKGGDAKADVDDLMADLLDDDDDDDSKTKKNASTASESSSSSSSWMRSDEVDFSSYL